MKKSEQRKLLESLRDLAPKRGGGITSITISTTVDGVEQSVELTPEDRERMDKMLKETK